MVQNLLHSVNEEDESIVSFPRSIFAFGHRKMPASWNEVDYDPIL